MNRQPNEKIAGIVAGVGPYAGLDMQRKVFDQTVAQGDADHITVIGWYQSNAVPDRTQFLLGKSNVNPGHALAIQVTALAEAGADAVAIPCNTAHAPPIFDTMRSDLQGQGCPVPVLHMIEEVAAYLSQPETGIECVGVLSTTGTYDTRLYPNLLEPQGIQVVVPSRDWQEAKVNPTIYDPHYGVKAVGTGTERARTDLRETIVQLKAEGAQAVILGCTELPLVFTETVIEGLPLIDPTLILARALIREISPEKLRPITVK
ncbi:MAG: amino acid racemase [Chloroflexota bacterium]